MTSTILLTLTGYGAATAPCLIQLSVHCDHLQSVPPLFEVQVPSPYGEKLAVLTTLL